MFLKGVKSWLMTGTASIGIVATIAATAQAATPTAPPLPERNYSKMFEKACVDIYFSPLAWLDDDHYYGKTKTKEKVIAEAALQKILERVQGEKPDLIPANVPSADGMTYYYDHCAYMRPTIEALYKSKGLKPSTLFGYALQGAIEASGRDRQTRYQPPAIAAAEAVEDQGKKLLFGMDVEIKDGKAIVNDITNKGGAQKAGILLGDIVTAINGQNLTGMTYEEILDLTLLNDKLDLQIERDGKQQKIGMEKIAVDVSPVTVAEIIGDTAVLKLTTFNEASYPKLLEAIHELKKQSHINGAAIRDYVLDLTGNGGGHSDQVPKIAGLFRLSSEKMPVSAREGREAGKIARKAIIYSDTGIPKIKRGSLYVLVNGDSASASEDLAGALKEHAGAIIIGTRTYGKASEQSTYTLSNGGELVFTSAAFFPGATRISHQCSGITPHLKVVFGDYRDEDNRQTCDDKAVKIQGIHVTDNKPSIATCSLKGKFSGMLKEDKVGNVPEYLKIKHIYKNMTTGAPLPLYEVNAALACSLHLGGNDQSQFVEIKMNTSHPGPMAAR